MPRSGAAGGGAIHLSTVTCVDARDQRASGCCSTCWLARGVVGRCDDVGWGGRGAAALCGQYPEVTPGVRGVIRQDLRDRRLVLCPYDGGFVPLRVRVPAPVVPHGRDRGT